MKLACADCSYGTDISPGERAGLGRYCPNCGGSLIEVADAGAPAIADDSIQPTRRQPAGKPASRSATERAQLDFSADALSSGIRIRLVQWAQAQGGLSVSLQVLSDHDLADGATIRLRTPTADESHSRPVKLSRLPSAEWCSEEIDLLLMTSTLTNHPSIFVRLFLQPGVARFFSAELRLDHFNGKTTINIDQSVRAGGDVFGGYNDIYVNLGGKGVSGGNVAVLSMREGTLLTPFRSEDYDLQDDLGLKSRRGWSESTGSNADPPLRLSLRNPSDRNPSDRTAPCRNVLLVAGLKLRMGRAKTWVAEHMREPPNDVVLRVLETAEPGSNYISNTHAVITRTEHGLQLIDYSKHGTTVGARNITARDSPCPLSRSSGFLKPGTAGADRPDLSLKLLTEIVPTEDQSFASKLSDLIEFARRRPAAAGCQDVLKLRRDDIPDVCLFMHTLLIVGYDAATCGWVLPQRGAGALRQAVIFRLDDALWITPFDRQSTVTFNSQRLQFEYFVRLRNGMTLRIDGHEFLVEPWKQWFERD